MPWIEPNGVSFGRRNCQRWAPYVVAISVASTSRPAARRVLLSVAAEMKTLP